MFKFMKPQFFNQIKCIVRTLKSTVKPETSEISLLENKYIKDDFTNITHKLVSHLNKNIYLQPYHPLSLVRQRIIQYFYKSFVNRRKNPIFSVYENLHPVVSVTQNFESLLVPENHPSRMKSDCYYVNKEYLLRAHMTAHQSELMQSGLNNFLMIGDVYRRDEIDKLHYPVFHQVDGVRLTTREQVFPKSDSLNIFEEGTNTIFTSSQQKQFCHTLEAVKIMEHELKETLEGLAKHLFGEKTDYRWVDAYFPFTQPSWELEVFYDNDWLELLGCGIMQQPILSNAGITNKIGWAFGLGLERIAMYLYKIPDIRLFWSVDSGFLNQFKVHDINQNITYKEISQFPQCTNDMSFWLPENIEFSTNDFYDLVRSTAGDLVEQVTLVDIFEHPKSKKTSHCYRIVYRHMERTLRQRDINILHQEIAKRATKELGITLR